MRQNIYLIMITAVSVFTFENAHSDTDLREAGDYPLKTHFVWEGYGEVRVSATAIPGISSFETSILVDSIPEGSEIVYSFLGICDYTNDNFSPSVIFSGIHLPIITPTAWDWDPSHMDFCMYRWDITDIVSGNGTFDLIGSDFSNCCVAYIVTVYSNPILPFKRIIVNDGSDCIDGNNLILRMATTSSFFGLAPGSSAKIEVITIGGQSISGDEELIFNGETIAGPGNIWNSNLGPSADYYSFEVNNITGVDSVYIVTGTDCIGAHLAILSGEPGPYPDLSVGIEPINIPVQIPASGGDVVFDIWLDISSQTTTGLHYWVEVLKPDGTLKKPLFLNTNIILGINQSIRRENICIYMPSSAAPGEYQLIFKTGLYPSIEYTIDWIDVEKLPEQNCISADNYQSDKLDYNSVQAFCLNIPSPNPFNNHTTISYELRDAGFVDLKVYDITGRKRATLVTGHLSPGQHSVVWNAGDVGSGVYFVRLAVNDGQQSVKKVVLVK